MTADPLTPAVSERICRHMNDDHGDAVLRYALHYGGISAASIATMTAVNADAMNLEVDGKPLRIPFDHLVSHLSVEWFATLCASFDFKALDVVTQLCMLLA